MHLPIQFYKTKTLSGLKPNSLVALKANGDTEFSLYCTDLNGLPIPLKDNTSGGVLTIQNTDGNLDVSGATTITININSALLTTINGALQSGDNVSELLNDSGYITTSDLPDTKAEFDTLLSDGNFLYVGDVIGYTDEEAQDAVGNILVDTATISLNYDDVGNQITADVQANSITANELSDTINVTEFLNDANYEQNVIETISSTGGSIDVTPVGVNTNIEVVQATESQLGGAEIVAQAVVEDETTTNDTEIVTAKKFWQGWTKGLTLTSFFNAVKGTILNGFNSSITWARVTSSTGIQDAISLLQRQSNYLQATRFISGTQVTINADPTKFDIQVIGEIVDPITFIPTAININLTAQTTTHIASQVESYIWITSAGTVQQSLTPPLPTDYDSIIGYWVLVHSNLTTINIINSFPFYADGNQIKVAQILNFIGFSKFPNTNIATEGTTGTRLQHSGGFAIKLGLGNTSKRPVASLLGFVDPANMEMRHRNLTFSTGVQDIDVTNYNPTGSTVSALNNNKFSVHKIWKFSSSLIRIQYGQKQYDSYNEAVSGVNADSYVDEGNAFRNGLHIGWLVFKKGTSWGIGGTGVDGVDYKFIDVKSNGSTGGLTPTMQAVYDISTLPQILINAIKGAFTLRSATGSDTDNVFQIQDNAGITTAYIKGDGSNSWFTETFFGAFINARTSKTTPVDADQIGLMDSADSNKEKKLSYANLKVSLLSYFDGFYNVPQITITTAVSIDTTTTVSGLGQKGRNVVIANGASTINYTVNATDGFVASFLKIGSASITFVQGSGRTLVQSSSTAVLSGIAGSTAVITSVGTTDYLQITNY